MVLPKPPVAVPAPRPARAAGQRATSTAAFLAPGAARDGGRHGMPGPVGAGLVGVEVTGPVGPPVDAAVSRRWVDAYIAAGFAGVHLLGAGLALVVWLVPEPSRSWHDVLALALFVSSWVPLAAAVGIARHVHRTQDRARARHTARMLGMASRRVAATTPLPAVTGAAPRGARR